MIPDDFNLNLDQSTADLAAKYQCSTRTIQRWKRLFSGVDEGRPWNDPRNTERLHYDDDRIPQNPLQVCVFDIEATSLNASFGRVLCAAIQSYDPPMMRVYRADAYADWRKGLRASDYELVRDILKYLSQFDIWFAHNGVGYDIPFLATKSIIHGLPPVQPRKVVDPVKIARSKMRFYSNSLDAISSTLGTEAKKSVLAPQCWQKALGDGDVESMNYIVDHCILDVKTLEEVARRFRPYIDVIDKFGSWR